jgi:hypothetical protein
VTRRPVLPGASELFRRTDTPRDEAEVTELPSMTATTSSPALRGRREEPADALPGMPLTVLPGGAGTPTGTDGLASYRGTPSPVTPPPGALRRGRPTKKIERTKHDEKITVYISADELLSLESARLTLRAQHGVAADRGRIVREAIAVVLADLAEHGDDSVLVRRLKG